jgi:hypothetical protein
MIILGINAHHGDAAEGSWQKAEGRKQAVGKAEGSSPREIGSNASQGSPREICSHASHGSPREIDSNASHGSPREIGSNASQGSPREIGSNASHGVKAGGQATARPIPGRMESYEYYIGSRSYDDRKRSSFGDLQ